MTVIFLIPFLLFPAILITIIIKLTSRGPSLYWSERIGLNNIVFNMPKFRTMKLEAPEVATHLLEAPDTFYTPCGSFLRRTSLDEIPQLYSILINKMTLVGPRPALHNQEDLIDLRNKIGVSKIKPGVTGWAQVNGRDDISINHKVELDFEYMQRKSTLFDCLILWKTFLKVIKRHGVSH